MDATHTLSLVREHFVKNLTMSDAVSLLMTDRAMHIVITNLLKRVPDNQKISFHLLRILKRPYKQRRSSLLRLTMLGDIDWEKDGSRDRTYNNVYAVTLRPSIKGMSSHFERSRYLARQEYADTEVYFKTIPKRKWRKVFGADIQHISIEHMGWNTSDIQSIKEDITAMLAFYGYTGVSMSTAQVREIPYDYLDDAVIPY